MKYGLVGCGRIAQKHAVHIAANGRLVAVCDIVPEKAVALAGNYGATAYYDIDELLRREAELDIVVICTPNGLHAAHSIKALNAARHVLCEKPMALTVPDCRAMISAAEQNNKTLFVVMQNRFNPPVQAVKKLLEQGKLGTVSSIQLNCFWNRDAAYYKDNWRGTREMDGGTLFTQFSHFIDLIYWMIGDVKHAEGLLYNYMHKDCIAFEDTGVVLLAFDNGVMGSLHFTINSHHKNMEGSLTIFGEKGTVKIGGEYLNRIDYQDIEGSVIDRLPAGNGANQYGSYQGSMSNHGEVYSNMKGFLQHRCPAYISAAEGMKTVEIIDKIYKAAKSI